MENSRLEEQARYLWSGESDRTELLCLSQHFGPLSMDEAYAIQSLGLKLRLAQGMSLTGWKMGLTSLAKRQQMNLDAAIFGYLLSEKKIEGDVFSIGRLIHPKIEPEIGFRLKKKLSKKITLSEAESYVESVAPALEIIDSRYKGFKYFSLPDVVADNCSASHFIWGKELPYRPGMNLCDLDMKLSIDEKVVESATAKEISGNPLESIVGLSELLEKYQICAETNSLVLAGSATNAVQLKAGMRVALQVSGMSDLKLMIS